MSDDFDKDLEEALDAAEKALNEGPYKKAMRDLLALSMAEIKGSVPKASYADYSKLLSVLPKLILNDIFIFSYLYSSSHYSFNPCAIFISLE